MGRRAFLSLGDEIRYRFKLKRGRRVVWPEGYRKTRRPQRGESLYLVD